MKEHTYLCSDGRFVTVPEYPEFVWKELIVNAIAHRDYSIKGTDIQIKMFDDHMVVESPGILPGIVRAPAPGQSAVFYDASGCILGGGEIF